MYKCEEWKVLIVVHDLQNNWNDEIHTLAIADRRKYVSDGAEDPFELILPFFRLHSFRGISPGKITLNLVYDCLVKILQGLAIFLVGRNLAMVLVMTDPVKDYILNLVVYEFCIVLTKFVLIENV